MGLVSQSNGGPYHTMETSDLNDEGMIINLAKILYPWEGGCINFSFHQPYYTWMLQNKEELQNIHNMNWWRSQKNEEERNLPRHANRSVDWIPSRLLKIRDKIIDTQLEYLFGEQGYLKGDNWKTPENHRCMRCKVKIEDIKNYQKGIVKLIEREKQRLGRRPNPEEFDEMLQRAMERVDRSHNIRTVAKSKAILPTDGSRTMTFHHHGFCIDCWENNIKRQLGYTMEV